MFLGPTRSILKEGEELIVGFSIPKKNPGQASAYMRVMIPQGTPIPILNVAIWVERNGDILQSFRIAAGPAQDFPAARRDLEEWLIARMVSEQIPFRSSKHRSSSQYRHHLVENLFLDTFQVAWNRAEGFQE